MARKRYAAEEIIGKLREAEVVLAQGESVAQVARRLGVAEPTYYRWRREYGGLRGRPGQAAERTGAREQSAEAVGGRSGAGQRDGAGRRSGKLLSPAKRRRAISSRTDQYAVSERRACQVTGQARATQRYVPRPSPDEPALIARIVALATRFGRYGSRRITALLRQEGWRVNHKRVERLWRQEGLRVPGKHPQRGRLWLAAGSLVRRRAERPSHVWSDDFVFDRTADGRPVRILAIVDAYTRECLSLDVARRLRSDDVLARLAQLFVERGPPTFLRSDNGPAFTATAVRDWLHRVGVTTLFIEPGSPWENGTVESFNGTRRDECLNRERFDTLLEAQILIEGWRRESNQIRPHSALGYRPPTPETQQPRERPMTLVPAIGLT